MDMGNLFGTECSNFVKDRLVEILTNDPTLPKDPVEAYNSAFSTVSSELHDSQIDDSLSGTTAIVVLVNGDTLYVTNVGDSRTVTAFKNGNSVLAEDLSWDQTPFRKDKCERVKLCDARLFIRSKVCRITISRHGEIMKVSVVIRQEDGLYRRTAFSKSVGDSIAEKIGVIAVPEISTGQLTLDHLFFVIASDGVFKFLPSQTAVDMMMRYKDSPDAYGAKPRHYH
ncbi:hypothetical protein ACHQM5_019598 [Ranunculus cassubicifolius]